MGAKEGFHKNVEPNNPHYDKDGEVMAKWTMSIYWGTDDSRCMSGTVNEYGYDFSNGKTIMTADDGYAYSKEDFGIEDVVRGVHDLVSKRCGPAALWAGPANQRFVYASTQHSGRWRF